MPNTSEEIRQAALHRQEDARRAGEPINSKVPDLVVTELDTTAIWARFNSNPAAALRKSIVSAASEK